MDKNQLSEADILIVGAGFYGATLAERIATQLGRRVLVIDRRRHIGGNAYTEQDPATGVEIHRYGPHLFHTSNEEVWNYLRGFTGFTAYRHRAFSTYRDKVYPLPINLATICQFFLDHNTKAAAEPRPGRRAARPHLNLIVRPDGRGETEDGVPVPRSMVERLACDAVVNHVGIDDHGHVLFYGRDKRTATDAQFAALVVRDRGCRFPDCHRPAWWCDAHHVKWWEHGGDTDIDNLVDLCPYHHTQLHNGAYTITHGPEGLVFTAASGKTIDPPYRS